MTGTETHDFSKLIAGIGKVTSALNVHEQELGELIVNFNTFFEAFADQNQSLTRLVAELPTSLSGITHGLRELGKSFGPTQAFATDILPGVKLTPATVKARVPWIEQVQASLGAERARRRRQGPRGRHSRAGQTERRTGPALQGNRSIQQVPDESHLPDRQREAPGRQLDLGRRELQGILVQPRRPVGDRAELRRQRRLRPVPGRQQRPDAGLETDLDRRPRRLGHRRKAADALPADAARHAPGVPGDRALLSAAAAVLQAGAAGSQQTPRWSTGRQTGASVNPPEHSHEGGLSVREQIERYRTAFISVRRAVRARRRRRRLHPRPREPPPAELGAGPRARLLRPQGGVPDRAGRHPRPGPGGDDRGRQSRRSRQRRSSQRDRDREHESDAQVRALLPQRDAADPPQDAAAGHHDRGQPRRSLGGQAQER